MMDTNTRQLRQETRNLSRFMGTKIAKWITSLLLLPVFFVLAPSSEYLLALALLLPLLLQAVFRKSDSDSKAAPILTLTQEKYHYSDAKFRAEKRANPLLLLFLCLWQYTMMSSELSPILRIYPALLIIINIISRLTATLLFRLYLHYQFTRLNMLEEDETDSFL